MVQNFSPDTQGHRKRLKEKFKHQGLAPFHDYEIIELILTYSIARKDVKQAAKKLLERFSSIRDVFDAPVEDLRQVDDIGEHSALLIKLVRACSDYYLQAAVADRDIISSPRSLLDYLRASMASLREEHFRVVYLNAKNELLHDELIQQGTVDQAAVYPRKIVERALGAGAVSIILVHNHPSGDPSPSSHDIQLTNSLVNATKLLSITVHDHIIVGTKGYYSFAENNRL